ncbi:hypothetical protein [Gracilimonas sediminicola]|uniref:hypothetical protein n=1 Tax=Gracilimonas sediminicola TaxID=2952158 RepID=UPI0038D3817C
MNAKEFYIDREVRKHPHLRKQIIDHAESGMDETLQLMEAYAEFSNERMLKARLKQTFYQIPGVAPNQDVEIPNWFIVKVAAIANEMMKADQEKHGYEIQYSVVSAHARFVLQVILDLVNEKSHV